MVIIKGAGRSLVAALRLKQDFDALCWGRMYVGVKEVVARVADHPGHGLANLANLGTRQGRLTTEPRKLQTKTLTKPCIVEKTKDRSSSDPLAAKRLYK